MSETKEIEIERRFLLKRLPEGIDWDKSILIEQCYVSDKDSDTIERLRQCIFRLSGEPTKFYHTAKERFSSMSVFETETEISRDMYKDLTTSGMVNRTISKTRYVCYVGDLKWEIDVFTGIDLVIGEIEIPEEDYDLDIPEWLSEVMVMEITGMHQFSNSNLAE